MMAVRAMGEEKVSGDSKGMVTACESYLPMVKLMRKVLHKNGMTKNINLINKRSDELRVGSDIASRADVLVSIHDYKDPYFVANLIGSKHQCLCSSLGKRNIGL